MCIITVIPEGTPLYDEEIFWNCATSNPDGFGLMFVRNAEVLIQKTMNAHEFLKMLRTVHKSDGASSPIVAHFRVGTCGIKTEYNCHPFYTHEYQLAFAHNGQIFKMEAGSKESDSRRFAQYLSKLPYGYHNNPSIIKLLEEYCGTDLMVFLDFKKQLRIINEKKGVWHDGIWYSNYGYRSFKQSTNNVILCKCSKCDYYYLQISEMESRREGTKQTWTCHQCLSKMKG